MKTTEYLNYQNEVRDEMMGIEWPFGSSPLLFQIEAGLSARQADLDNLMKPLFDTFQNIFEEFNDNKVYRIEADKYIVPKGAEFVRIRIHETTEPTREEESSAEEETKE